MDFKRNKGTYKVCFSLYVDNVEKEELQKFHDFIDFWNKEANITSQNMSLYFNTEEVEVKNKKEKTNE